MSLDESGSPQFKDIKAKFETVSSASTSNSHQGESAVSKTRRIFEKTKNPINASNRFKPALKPKPKYLSQPNGISSVPPVPKHGILNRSIISPASGRKFNFNNTQNSNGSLRPPLSSPSSSPESFRDSGLGDLPHTPVDQGSSSDDSSDDDSVEDVKDSSTTTEETSKADTLHTAIINQMKSEGLFRQLESIKEHHHPNGIHEFESNADEAEDASNNVVFRRAPDIPPHRVFEKYSDAASEALKETYIWMERLIVEIGMTEEYFVKILSLIVRTFPEYLTTCKIQGSKYGTQFRAVVDSVVQELEPVLKAHEHLLNELVQICSTWDSRSPNLAQLMLKNVDFLKIAIPFISKRKQLHADFISTTKADQAFSHATEQFATQIMNNDSVHNTDKFDEMPYKPINVRLRNTEVGNNGISFVSHLDMPHQNVARYKLFVIEYKKLLEKMNNDDDVVLQEIAFTNQVLEKLSNIVKIIDAKVGQPEAIAFLLKVYDVLHEKNFDVLSPGRRFVKEGGCLRQTRKDLSERKLILFSDCLLICHSDYSQFWKLDLRRMAIQVDEEVEADKWFKIYSPKKSTAILCQTKLEKETWVKNIRQTQEEYIALKRKNDTPIEDDGESQFSALWVADDEVTTCMMLDCAAKFHLLNRRHHCRKCGYVICGDCSGFALLANGSTKSSRVCPACYYEIAELLHGGEMLWPSNVTEVTGQTVKFSNGKVKEIRKLFTPPANGKKIRGDNYGDKSKYLSYGSIWTKNGQRYARLTNDFNFYIYSARYDPHPVEHHYLKDYSYVSSESSNKNRKVFKLFRKTGLKNVEVEFEVQEKMLDIWEYALKQL